MINRKINQKEVEDMERMRKTVLYLTSFLLLGCLGWVFFHALCTIPQAKNILKNRTVFPLILAGSIFLLLLFVKFSVPFCTFAASSKLGSPAIVTCAEAV